MSSLYNDLVFRIDELARTMGDSVQLRGLKTGGVAGQVPVKQSSADFDWGWAGSGGGGGGASVTVSPTPPEFPNVGDVWYDSETGVSATYEGTTWIGEANPTPATLAPTSAIVSSYTTGTGGTITAVPHLDETVYLDSVSTAPVPAIALILPAAANSVAGQVKTFISSKTISALTVTVSGSGTLLGSPLTSASAFSAYAFQCVSNSGTGTWIRLS